MMIEWLALWGRGVGTKKHRGWHYEDERGWYYSGKGVNTTEVEGVGWHYGGGALWGQGSYYGTKPGLHYNNFH